MLGDDLRQLVVVAGAHDRRKIVAPRDGINFADALHIGKRLGDFVGLVSLGV